MKNKYNFNGEGFGLMEKGINIMNIDYSKLNGKFHNHYKDLFIPNHEVWKTLPNSDNTNQVSTFGRVRSITRVVKRINNTKSFLKKGRVLSTPDSGDGQCVNVRYKGSLNCMKVQHLVLFTFVGEKLDGMECCHYDGNAVNNKLENLRWDTHLANEEDKRRHGTGNVGERNRSAKLTRNDVLEIRKLYATGNYSYSKLMKSYSITVGTIAPIITGKTWNYLDCYPDGYIIPKKRTPEECFRGVNRWTNEGCKPK